MHYAKCILSFQMSIITGIALILRFRRYDGAMGEPYFVVQIDPQDRRIVIGRHADLACRSLVAGRTNWFVPAPESPQSGLGRTQPGADDATHQVPDHHRHRKDQADCRQVGHLGHPASSPSARPARIDLSHTRRPVPQYEGLAGGPTVAGFRATETRIRGVDRAGDAGFIVKRWYRRRRARAVVRRNAMNTACRAPGVYRW